MYKRPELGDFIRQVREQWPDAPLEEVTVEANHDDLSPVSYTHLERPITVACVVKTVAMFGSCFIR